MRGRLDLVRRQRRRGRSVPLAPTTWNAGPLAVRADRQHARRGLDVVAAHEQRGVDAVALEQGEQHVAGRVGADRAGALHLRRRASRARAPCRRPSPPAVIRISSTSSPPWPSGIASTGRTSTSSTCTPMRRSPSSRRSSLLVRPGASCRSRARARPRPPPGAAPRRARAARRSRRRASRPCTPTRAAARSSSAVGRVAARARSRRGSPSARRAGPRARRAPPSASSGVPNVAYGATRTGPAEQRASRSARTAARRARTTARWPSARGCGRPRRRRSAR